MSNTELDSLNESNFILLAKLLSDIDAFPFFGTLLGLHRDGKIISGDDDVDFYVDINQKDKLVKILSESCFNVDLDRECNKTDYFLQGTRTSKGVTSKVDFYFFQKENGILKERWNFCGDPMDSDNALHIPMEYVYPLKEHNYQQTSFDMPRQPSLVCEFLYGDEWTTPKSGSEYEILIINNSPEVIIYSRKTILLKKLISHPSLISSASEIYDRGGIKLLSKKMAMFIYDKFVVYIDL